jgi:ParB family chromosome partitioning protein
MARRPGLGKGLDALIPGGDFSPQKGTTEDLKSTNQVPIDKIIPNPHQPRQEMVPEKLEELANSIREHGVLQPLIVSEDKENDRFVLIAGERRLRASKMADLTMVPVIIRQVTEQQQLELALIENVQRADLSPLETAEAYRQLNEEFNLSQEVIAERVGKSRVAVTNTMRLLKLPQQVQNKIASGEISEGHARAILGLTTPQAQLAAMKSILTNGLTVRQTEELVRKMNGEKNKEPKSKPRSPEIVEVENLIRDALGTKVTLNHGKNGGSIILHYYSSEELDALISKLTGD